MSYRAAVIIGKQLEAARKARGLSAADAATVLGVKRQMIYNYEKGRSLPRLDVLMRAASEWDETFTLEGCNVIPDQLKESAGNPPKPVQLELAFKQPRSYKARLIKIRRVKNELIITAVARVSA
jgi:transcriptional regulator with XRE-family HTH domain